MGFDISHGNVDVLVVGAGPAGATVALNLAPLHSVLMIDSRATPRARIGECLPPAARRLLSDMGLWDSFQAEGHSPCYANRAVWGSSQPIHADVLRDPDGNGWHLDRSRFETWLRAVAVARGAMALAPAHVESICWQGEGWRARIKTAAGIADITARVVLDAGGRTARVARHLGGQRRVADKLICGWLYGRTGAHGAGFTYVEAVEDGWWYTAPAGEGRRVIAFHTDSDLSAARLIARPEMLLERTAASSELTEVLSESAFTPTKHFGVTAANTAILKPVAGHRWFALGDAALSFDPLSCQGLLNALFTGLAAAEAADRVLSGNEAGVRHYQQTLAGIHAAYLRQLTYWYSAEKRWMDASFWQRRHVGPGGFRMLPASTSDLLNSRQMAEN
ncbi:MAG: NAD(P)/FAD-dependent oxidoreductase [Acidobacteria bacterium]|nr:NAD(P)/FAD-dependent oxidoreductase [Acidobacteriota bacterium]